MKNEEKNGNCKMENGNDPQSKIKRRMFNLIVEKPNLKGKSNLTTIPNRGSIRGIEARFCKGPPGRSRSPGVGDGLFPEHPPDNETRLNTNSSFIQRSLSFSYLSLSKMSKGNTVHTKDQYINTNDNSNFY